MSTLGLAWEPVWPGQCHWVSPQGRAPFSPVLEVRATHRGWPFPWSLHCPLPAAPWAACRPLQYGPHDCATQRYRSWPGALSLPRRLLCPWASPLGRSTSPEQLRRQRLQGGQEDQSWALATPERGIRSQMPTQGCGTCCGGHGRKMQKCRSPHHELRLRLQ